MGDGLTGKRTNISCVVCAIGAMDQCDVEKKKSKENERSTTTPTADLLGLSTVEMEEQVELCGDQAVQQLDDQGKEKENYLG